MSRLALLLGLTSLLSATAVPAAVYCVDNDAELIKGMQAALASPQADELRLVAGTYAAHSFGVASNFVGDLHVSGGWQGGNCSSQSQDARLTVIDGLNTEKPLSISVQSPDTIELKISNLRLRNGRTLVSGSGGCLVAALDQGTLVLERLIVSDCVAPLGAAGGADLQAPNIKLLGNLFIRNAARFGAAAQLNIQGGSAWISNNTIVDNLAEGAEFASGGLELLGTGVPVAFLSNNILWGNTTGSNRSDLDFSQLPAGSVTLVRNHVQIIAGTPTGLSNNNSSGDPGFVSYPDNLFLRANSVARNSGTNTPIGGISAFDVFGAERI